MKTVAVTGGIGSGKSTVCRLLSSRGIPVYDCDSSAKGLWTGGFWQASYSLLPKGLPPLKASCILPC